MKKQHYFICGLLFFVLLCTAGCAARQKSKSLSLKIGLMPAVDAAPMLLAEKKGYFQELGMTVELEIFTNAQNRQSALQTYVIDGAMTDLHCRGDECCGWFRYQSHYDDERPISCAYEKGQCREKADQGRDDGGQRFELPL